MSARRSGISVFTLLPWLSLPLVTAAVGREGGETHSVYLVSSTAGVVQHIEEKTGTEVSCLVSPPPLVVPGRCDYAGCLIRLGGTQKAVFRVFSSLS